MSPLKIVKVDASSRQDELIREAAGILKAGGLVIMPTDTVYGVAASAAEQKAIDRLYEIKKRPQDKPFSLLIAEKNKIKEFCADIPLVAYKLIDKFWPGPLTIILKATQPLASLGAYGERSRTIGLRMPDNQLALKIIAEAGVALACPSANISGKPAPKNFQEAIKDLKDMVELAIDAGEAKLGQESSIVDLTVRPIEVVREQAIKKEELLKIAQKKIVLFICTGNSCRSVMAKALLEKRLREACRQDVEVLSAGIMIPMGLGATEATIEILAKDGIDVSGHVSQRVTIDMLDKSDIILTMEKLQEERVLELAPEVKNRLFLLKEFAKIKDHGLDIQDPIGKTGDFYSQTYLLIKEAVDRIINII